MLRALILKLFPNMAERFEAESRQWMIQCPNCKFEINVWDAGGIRYKARGTVRRFARCPNCQRFSMLRVYRPERAEGTGPE